MHVDLEGKIALVTGGSGAIGQAVAVELARAGATVAFTYLTDRDGAEQTQRLIEAEGQTAHMLRANFADEHGAEALVAELATRVPRVDVLVNNAASGVLRPTAELDDRHWQWCMDTNARALLQLARALTGAPDADADAASPRIPDGGRVVALSSLGAARAIPQYAAVGASKAALEALARHLALDLGPRGIRVNVVSPGIVDTRALRHFPNREQLLDVARQRTPLGRIATPADVAQVVLFLCSDAAAMIHGQTLHVDGGYTVVA